MHTSTRVHQRSALVLLSGAVAVLVQRYRAAVCAARHGNEAHVDVDGARMAAAQPCVC